MPWGRPEPDTNDHRYHLKRLTTEREESEEFIYGEAMLAITEWRETRKALEEARRRPDKLDARKHVVELEIRLVEVPLGARPPHPRTRPSRQDGWCGYLAGMLGVPATGSGDVNPRFGC